MSTVWYWPEYDELLILVSNEVLGDFDPNELETGLPRLLLVGCIYIGEL